MALASLPLLASASPAPATQPVKSTKIGDHGDGLYISDSDNGTMTYTYHGTGKLHPVRRSHDTTLGRRLNPDESVVCMAGGNVLQTDLTNAQAGIAAQLGDGSIHIKHNKNVFVSFSDYSLEA
jgi:hypothetical protein